VFRNLSVSDREVWSRARNTAMTMEADLAAAWNAHEYPLEVVESLGAQGLFNDGLEHPELEYFSPLAASLVNMEISRVDGCLVTVLAVQGGLALRTLVYYGSQLQQDQYIEPLSQGKLLGSFALTEPDHGSDSAGLATRATRTASGWVLCGAKKWIGNGASGGLTFVWARVDSP